MFLLLTVGMEYSVGLIDKEKILKTLNCRVLRFTKLIFNSYRCEITEMCTFLVCLCLSVLVHGN